MSLLQIYYRVRQLKKVLKSVNIWWSYEQQVSDIFFFLTHSADGCSGSPTHYVSAELNLKIKRSVFGDFFFFLGGGVKAVRPRRQITYKRHVIGRLLAPETIPVIHNILCQYMLVCMMAPPAECIGKTRHALPISYFIDQWRLTFWHKIQNSNNIVSRTLSYLKHHFFVA